RHTIFDCDWSSDVCSSDLSASALERGPRLRAEVVELLAREHEPAHAEGLERLRVHPRADAAGELLALGEHVAPDAERLEVVVAQIGRASGRERVQISVDSG